MESNHQLKFHGFDSPTRDAYKIKGEQEMREIDGENLRERMQFVTLSHSVNTHWNAHANAQDISSL